MPNIALSFIPHVVRAINEKVERLSLGEQISIEWFLNYGWWHIAPGGLSHRYGYDLWFAK